MKKIKITTAVFYLIAVISALFPYCMALSFHLSTSELFGRGCSVGVVGDADAPSGIFMNQGRKVYDLSIIFGALSLLGTVLLFILKGKVKWGENR